MQNYIKSRFEALKRTKPWIRRTVGVLLVIGGLLWFLPVLGLWMLPLGLGLLSVDSPRARRAYRRLYVWLGRGRQYVTKSGEQNRGSAGVTTTRTSADSPDKHNGP